MHGFNFGFKFSTNDDKEKAFAFDNTRKITISEIFIIEQLRKWSRILYMHQMMDAAQKSGAKVFEKF